MKILYCSPLLAYEGHFAREAAMKSVVMAEAGLDVTILGFPETLDGMRGHPRVNYISVQEGWSPEKKARIQAWRLKFHDFWLFIIEIWWVHWFAFRYAFQQKYDLIYISEVEPWLLIPGLLLARLFGRRTPVVGLVPYVFYHKSTVLHKLRLTTCIRGRLNQWSARWLPLLGINLVCTAAPIRQYLFRYRLDRVHVIYQGFEQPARIWSKAEARQRLGLAGGRRIVLLFGLASYAKGSDLLMNAIEGMPPVFDICMVGKVGGQHQVSWGADRFRGTAWEKHLHVVSRFVTEEEKCLYYSACDAAVVPYRYGFMTNSGQVSDAVTFGKALIACDQFEIGRYTRDYRLGLLFKTEDVADLRRALEEFAAKPDAWFEEIARRCREMVEEFSMPNMGCQYHQLFASVLEREGKPEDRGQTTDAGHQTGEEER